MLGTFASPEDGLVATSGFSQNVHFSTELYSSNAVVKSSASHAVAPKHQSTTSPKLYWGNNSSPSTQGNGRGIVTVL
jgi:hypothetical protein